VKVIYPGSFDPVTNGHLNIIERISGRVELLIIALGVNLEKKTVFTVEERADFLKSCTSHLKNVSVEMFEGMTVDFCKKKKITTIIRGIRGMLDVDAEISMALTNRSYDSEIETLFLTAAPEHAFISSKLIQETAALGGGMWIIWFRKLLRIHFIKNFEVKKTNKFLLQK